MENETVFRLTVVVLFVSLAIIAMYHRIRATKSDEKITRKKEGLPIMILLRLFGFSMWAGLLIYMINPVWMEWSSIVLPAKVRWLGAGLALFALPLIYWMFSSLGKNITDTVDIREEHQLVNYGPYRYVRHPMYLFSSIYFTGIGLTAANWFILVTGLLALFMLMTRTPNEEKHLIEKFGDEYIEYMKQTGRFFPRFTKTKPGD